MLRILSEEERTTVEIVNLVSICGIISIFGISSNIINVIILHKQGFKNTVNIGFFGMAVSDINCLLSLTWGSVCMNPLLTSLGTYWFSMEVMYLTVAWPHICFTRITSWITAFVTAERYLSIALPLKVKRLITPKTTTLIMCVIYVINLVSLAPEYATSYLGWRFVPARNETLIGILFTSSRQSTEGVIYFLHFMLGMTSFTGVVVFTILLVMKLVQSSKWRMGVTQNNSNREAISERDKRTVRMVIFIATVLIFCYSPAALISLSTFILGPEFNIRGKYINTCEAMWSTAFIFQAINSSVNIFVYYSMSSKYRQTFHEVFMRRKLDTH